MKILGLVLSFVLLVTTLAFAGEQKVMIQVRFKEQTAHGEYNDALYFTPEQYEKTKQEQIDTLKQQRIDNWIYILEHPPEYIEPTPKELQKQIDELEQQKQVLILQKAEIEARKPITIDK